MEIAILGGGVAGVSCAIALKQKGFDVKVYERHKCASNIGAGIVVWPNATYVLEQLGVLSDIKAVSGYPTRMQRFASTGEDLGAIDIESINRHMGYPSLSILRRDFQDILITKLESLGVAIQYDFSVSNIETTDTEKAAVHFRNGSRVTADVLIGADGRMASFARRYVHGDNAPVYQEFINWIGVCESEKEIFQEIAVADYWGIGARFGIVPISRYKAYWAGGVASTSIGPNNPADYQHELTTVFANWPAPVKKMIEHTPVGRINKVYVHDHHPINTWHKNNLIVIGDAAHAPLPTSGQGACQALEDAWVFTNCLLDNPNNLEQVFGAFTALRFEKTASIIQAARSFASSLFNRDANYCKARNEMSKNTDFAAMAAAMSKAWGRHLPLSG